MLYIICFETHLGRGREEHCVEETQSGLHLRINCMINPNDEDFMEDDPLAGSRPNEKPMISEAKGPVRQRVRRISGAAGETWGQTKARASAARERTEFFLRENPVPMILGALAAGLAIGLAIRYASSHPEEEEVKIKSPLGSLNWSFLSLPFLLPFFKSVREKYEDSAEVVRDRVDRLKKIDLDRYAKPVRKRWKAWTH